MPVKKLKRHDDLTNIEPNFIFFKPLPSLQQVKECPSTLEVQHEVEVVLALKRLVKIEQERIPKLSHYVLLGRDVVKLVF